MINFSCSHCGRKFELADDKAGRRATCSCGEELTVPLTAEMLAQRAAPALKQLHEAAFDDAVLGDLPGGSAAGDEIIGDDVRQELEEQAAKFDPQRQILDELRRQSTLLEKINGTATVFFVVLIVFLVLAVLGLVAAFFGHR